MTRHLQEILSTSEELYQLLVQHSSDAVVFFDLSETILAANDAAAQLLGVQTPEELVGQNAIALLNEEDRPRGHEDVARLLGCEWTSLIAPAWSGSEWFASVSSKMWAE